MEFPSAGAWCGLFFFLSAAPFAGASSGIQEGCDPPGAPVTRALLDSVIREEYEALRRNYVDSGRCHLVSGFSDREQAAFYASLLRYEIDALSGRNPKFSREEALESLGAWLGWGSEEARRWASLSLSPKELQMRMVQEVSRKAGTPDLRKALEPRVKWHLDRLGVKDCDDFPSFSVFRAARESFASHLDRVPPGKRQRLTLFDRSQSASDRRMIVLDLETRQVLLHTRASFGDGRVGGASGPESSQCSTQAGSGLSPPGPALTTRKGRAANGSFRGEGVFFEIPSDGDSRGDWSGSRGLALHAMSADAPLNLRAATGGITPDFEKLARGERDPKALDRFLYTPISPVQVRVPATDGCVGIPEEAQERVTALLTGGDFLYFYCPDAGGASGGKR